MILPIEAQFTFKPIGQGCFYTGRINVRGSFDNQFDFVYDCGTYSKMRYLDNEINIYKTELKNETLDLLIISHFDEDHVNGVVNLLRDIKCKRLIIPYYEPIERLLLYATSTSEDDGYRAMLQNPINYFIGGDFDIDEILLIGGPDEDEEGAEINPNNPKPDGSNSDNFSEGEEFKFTTVYVEGSERDQLINDILQKDGDTNINEKLQFIKKPYSVKIDIWEFIFYLKKHDNRRLIEAFTNDVDALLNQDNGKITDLFDSIKVAKLKQIYRKYYGQNLNNTSLVTYHGPTINHVHPIIRPFGNYSRYFSVGIKKCGTLLTGDIDISSARACEAMLNYFTTQISKIRFFQVPHHGAKANWNFRNPNGLEIFGNYVINHGLGRAHHPSTDVVSYIKDNYNNSQIHLNNEVNEFEYYFAFLEH